ncbi:MAG: ATP-binding protein [Actinomycetota bacterium]|nr:ATP-binding protein [Actinomycetota bacterium]
MNLFRSEEHVRRWPLYSTSAEDYVLPISTWAQIFSGQLFRERLAPDYLEKGKGYVAEYHDAIREAGKTSPYWNYPLIANLDTVRLSRYRVVGAYTRFDDTVLNDLKDARNRIVNGLEHASRHRENHLVWAAPGSGKTFFVEQIAASIEVDADYREVNLAKLERHGFEEALADAISSQRPTLCLVDEVDSRATEVWPYEILMPYLDANLAGRAHIVFVLAGSSGFSIEGMKERIQSRPKGADVLSRISSSNQFTIEPLGFGDRVLVALSQLQAAGKAIGHEIDAVEKLGLYHIAVNDRLASARQLQEFAAAAVERIPRGDDRVKYDHFFVPGDPENKRFWVDVANVARDLVNAYVTIEA